MQIGGRLCPIGSSTQPASDVPESPTRKDQSQYLLRTDRGTAVAQASSRERGATLTTCSRPDFHDSVDPGLDLLERIGESGQGILRASAS